MMATGLFQIAIEAAKKLPWWDVLLRKAAERAAITATQKKIEKLTKEKEKSLKQRLRELKQFFNVGEITRERYEETKRALLDRYEEKQDVV